MSRSDRAAEAAATMTALREIHKTATEALNYVLDPVGMEVVTFEWSTQYGTCQDCGLPAAYKLLNVEQAGGGDILLCSVDAAYHAAHGDEIYYLHEEEEQ